MGKAPENSQVEAALQNTWLQTVKIIKTKKAWEQA